MERHRLFIHEPWGVWPGLFLCPCSGHSPPALRLPSEQPPWLAATCLCPLLRYPAVSELRVVSPIPCQLWVALAKPRAGPSQAQLGLEWILDPVLSQEPRPLPERRCPVGSLQVLVMELSDEKSEHAISVATLDLLQDREGFTWKGHDRLAPKNGTIAFTPGFQPSILVQCLPPAAVTAVTLHSEWNLVAFGTSHGFGLFDYYRRNPVLAR